MPALRSFQFHGKARDSYLECVTAFPLTTIASQEHLAAAQHVMDRLLARGKLDKGELAYLNALSDLTASYEAQHVSFAPASDANMLRHLLDAKGISPSQLHQHTGLSKSSLSEVLAGKKPLSRQMIRKLAEYFQVDIGVLAGNL